MRTGTVIGLIFAVGGLAMGALHASAGDAWLALLWGVSATINGVNVWDEVSA